MQSRCRPTLFSSLSQKIRVLRYHGHTYTEHCIRPLVLVGVFRSPVFRHFTTISQADRLRKGRKPARLRCWVSRCQPHLLFDSAVLADPGSTGQCDSKTGPRTANVYLTANSLLVLQPQAIESGFNLATIGQHSCRDVAARHTISASTC